MRSLRVSRARAYIGVVPSPSSPWHASSKLIVHRRQAWTDKGLIDCSRCRLRTQLRMYSDDRKSSANKGLNASETQSISNTTSRPGINGGEPEDGRTPELPSSSERRRTQLSKRFTHVMDHLQTNIFTASQRLNDLTGYSGIEALKNSIVQQEALVSSTRARVQRAKENYTNAIATRSASQREVNDLLQRKNTWSPLELERFTSLYRSDHANEIAEQQAQQELADAEAIAEDASSELSKNILARYHEEQIWSDKIRRMSTWGTWGLMGVNVLLFLVFQVLVEPWRRARLVQGFDEKVRDALAAGNNAQGSGEPDELAQEHMAEEYRAQESLESIARFVQQLEPLAENVRPLQEVNVDIAPLFASMASTRHGSLVYRGKTAFRDMFSKQQVMIRKADLTTYVLEGVAVGATITGLVFAVLRKTW